jgi:valyl-tRNA synthetase
MIMLSKYFTSKLDKTDKLYNTIPFKDLVITPTVLDDKGKKMSKSLGNGLDPVAQIDKYSSDALRMAMLSSMVPDRNMKFGGTLADRECEKYRNFGNKLWNSVRFFGLQRSVQE